ncbi:MAG TPA: type II secretion system minor pseudopilin GspK [Geobacteraceae bacterium]|nr:type II secretion system minor pseudopilin GspK [Geobacteraceae bacterium]
MKGEKGFALVITLIITALVVAVTTEFIHDVFVETSLQHNYADAQQASLIASAGVNGAVKVLKIALTRQEYTSLEDDWASSQVLEDERGSLRISITEESGKLNLNSIVFPNGTLNEAYYGIAVRLFEKLGYSSDSIDVIADWIDTDDSPRAGGAESGYYKSLSTPYQSKNARLETYDELKLVSGFDDAALRSLYPYVTVYAESAAELYSKINVNTAPPELLAVLDERMTDDLAERIVEYRKITPLKSSSEITQISGMESIGITLQGKITVKGTIFRIQSRAQVRETVRIVEAVVRVIGTSSTVLYWREL